MKIVSLTKTGYIAEELPSGELRFLNSPHLSFLTPTSRVLNENYHIPQPPEPDFFSLIEERNQRVLDLAILAAAKRLDRPRRKTQKAKEKTLQEKILDASPTELIELLKTQGVSE